MVIIQPNKENMSTEQPDNKTADNQNDQIISYLTLRVLIGATGILLPLLVVLGKFISEQSGQLEFSISDYYDNGSAGDLLVGVLFVLGFFLLSYKGPERIDNRAADVGCVAALGLALFPTTYCSDCWVHIMHFVFALLLFSVFIFFSVYLFRKTNPDKTITTEKKYRNRVYLTCGIIMIVCIVAIAVSLLVLDASVSEKYKLVYWFESIALVSFGISWITKSESFYLKDKKTT
jgi:magnesium-transporting ATPase (P-type)